MGRNFLSVIFLIVGTLCSLPVLAVPNESPIGIGIFPPVQFPGSEFGVTGIRLSVVGVNRAASGIDLALLGNMTNQSFKGLAISGLFNYNKVGADIIGLQFATLANINGTGSSLYGVQIGAYNAVTNAYGIQIGLVNVAERLHGIQIGLLNFNAGGPFKASPIINASF